MSTRWNSAATSSGDRADLDANDRNVLAHSAPPASASRADRPAAVSDAVTAAAIWSDKARTGGSTTSSASLAAAVIASWSAARNSTASARLIAPSPTRALSTAHDRTSGVTVSRAAHCARGIRNSPPVSTAWS